MFRRALRLIRVPGGPQGVVPTDDVPTALRRRFHAGNRFQNVPDITCLDIPLIKETDQRISGYEFFRCVSVSLAYLVEFCLVGIVRLFGERRQLEQLVSHTAHCGHDDTDAAVRHRQNVFGYALKTSSISKAAAAEFVNFPVIARHACVRSSEWPKQSG